MVDQVKRLPEINKLGVDTLLPVEELSVESNQSEIWR